MKSPFWIPQYQVNLLSGYNFSGNVPRKGELLKLSSFEKNIKDRHRLVISFTLMLVSNLFFFCLLPVSAFFIYAPTGRFVHSRRGWDGFPIWRRPDDSGNLKLLNMESLETNTVGDEGNKKKKKINMCLLEYISVAELHPLQRRPTILDRAPTLAP